MSGTRQQDPADRDAVRVVLGRIGIERRIAGPIPEGEAARRRPVRLGDRGERVAGLDDVAQERRQRGRRRADERGRWRRAGRRRCRRRAGSPSGRRCAAGLAVARPAGWRDAARRRARPSARGRAPGAAGRRRGPVIVGVIVTQDGTSRASAASAAAAAAVSESTGVGACSRNSAASPRPSAALATRSRPVRLATKQARSAASSTSAEVAPSVG